jgi:hypothetical protein
MSFAAIVLNVLKPDAALYQRAKEPTLFVTLISAAAEVPF